MNSSQLHPDNSEVIEVNSWADRWQVYRRLQELGIPSSCEIEQPLRVQINNINQAVQLSSVLKQFSASRRDLLETLERCWKAESD
ncbi:MAG: Asr1405/Asl0597 family protein [Limnoraphis sp.]|nr:Asr1405/Asl0597 family protein [Lyngbya sp. PCC 8106]